MKEGCRPCKIKSRPHGRSIMLAVQVKSQPDEGSQLASKSRASLKNGNVLAVQVKGQPDEGSLPAVRVKGQSDEGSLWSRKSVDCASQGPACRRNLLSRSFAGCAPSRPASLNKSVGVKSVSKSVSNSMSNPIKSKSKRRNQKLFKSVKASEPSSCGSPPRKR